MNQITRILRCFNRREIALAVVEVSFVLGVIGGLFAAPSFGAMPSARAVALRVEPLRVSPASPLPSLSQGER